MTNIYYGEKQCQAFYSSGSKKGQQCQNFAYFFDQKNYLCGMHSNKISRKKLSKNPKRTEIVEKDLQEKRNIVEMVAEDNRKKELYGNVICTKLRMLKSPQHIDGYLKVFPNFKHQYRKDGFGCASLSPKSLGPIDHQMPGLPISLNLENFHQFSKVFSSEVDKNQNPTKEFHQRRVAAFHDKEPHRHKFSIKEMEKVSKNGNKNIPLYSTFPDKDGNNRKFTYLESRYFYCHFYQLLIPLEEDFNKLIDLIKNGYNLQIVGYDGYPITQDLYQHYLDISKPFGHELVLYTLLTVEDETKYPWNRFYQEHSHVYKNVL